jgi:hypothetical protein
LLGGVVAARYARLHDATQQKCNPCRENKCYLCGENIHSTALPRPKSRSVGRRCPSAILSSNQDDVRRGRILRRRSSAALPDANLGPVGRRCSSASGDAAPPPSTSAQPQFWLADRLHMVVVAWKAIFAIYQSEFSFLCVSIPCHFMSKTLENKGFSCPNNVQKNFKKKLTSPCRFVILRAHTVTTEHKYRKTYEN